MTINEYIDQLIVESRENVDESDIDRRLVERWINSQRALWIRNKAFKGTLTQSKTFQTIKELEMTPSPERFGDDSESSNNYLVSIKKVPSIIEVKGTYLIDSCRVSGLNGKSITILPREEVKYAGNGRLNNSDLFGFIYNDRLFIKIPKNDFKTSLITNIDIDAVFENPREVSIHVHDGGFSYDVENTSYPLSDTVWDYIAGQIKSNNIASFKNIRKDEVNDLSEGDNRV